MKRHYDRFSRLPERPIEPLSSNSQLKRDVTNKSVSNVSLNVNTPLVNANNKSNDWSLVQSPFSTDSNATNNTTGSQGRVPEEDGTSVTPLRSFGANNGNTGSMLGAQFRGFQEAKPRVDTSVIKKQSSQFAGLSSKSTSVSQENKNIDQVMTSSSRAQPLNGVSNTIKPTERDKGTTDAQDKKEDVKYSTVLTPILDVKRAFMDTSACPHLAYSNFRFLGEQGKPEPTVSLTLPKGGSVRANMSVNSNHTIQCAGNNLSIISLNNEWPSYNTFVSHLHTDTQHMHPSQFVCLPNDENSDGEMEELPTPQYTAPSAPMEIQQRANDQAVYGLREFHPYDESLLLAERKPYRSQTASAFDITVLDINTMVPIFNRPIGEKGCRQVSWSKSKQQIVHYASHHTYAAFDIVANMDTCVLRKDSALQSIDVHATLPHYVLIVLETMIYVYDNRIQKTCYQQEVSRGIACAYFHPSSPKHVIYATGNAVRFWDFENDVKRNTTPSLQLLYSAQSFLFLPNSNQMLVTHQRSNVVTLCDPAAPAFNTKQLSQQQTVSSIISGNSECSYLYSLSKGSAGDVVTRHHMNEFQSIAPDTSVSAVEITLDHVLISGEAPRRPSVLLGVDNQYMDIHPATQCMESRYKNPFFPAQEACMVTTSTETLQSMVMHAQENQTQSVLFPTTTNGQYYVNHSEGVDYTKPISGFQVTPQQMPVSTPLPTVNTFFRKMMSNPAVRAIKLARYLQPPRVASMAHCVRLSTEAGKQFQHIFQPLPHTPISTPHATFAAYAQKLQYDSFRTPYRSNIKALIPTEYHDCVDVCLLFNQPPPESLQSSLTESTVKIPQSLFLFLSPLIRRIFAFLYTCLYNKHVCHSFECPRMQNIGLLWLTLTIAIAHHFQNILQNVIVSIIQSQGKCTCSVQQRNTRVLTLKGIYGVDVATIQAGGQCILCSINPILHASKSLLQQLSAEMLQSLSVCGKQSTLQQDNQPLYTLLSSTPELGQSGPKDNVIRMLVSSVFQQCICVNDIITLSCMTCCVSTAFSKVSYFQTTIASPLSCAFGVDPPPHMLPPQSQYSAARSLHARLRKHYKLLSNCPVDALREAQSFPSYTPSYTQCLHTSKYLQQYIEQNRHIKKVYLPLLRNAQIPLDVTDDVFARKESSPVLIQQIYVLPERTRLEAVTAAMVMLKRQGQYHYATAILKNSGVPFLFEANKRGVSHAVSCGQEHSNPVHKIDTSYCMPYQLYAMSLLEASFLQKRNKQKVVLEDNSDQTARPQSEAVLQPMEGISELFLVDQVICCICNAVTSEHITVCSKCNHAACLTHANEWFMEYRVCPAGCGCFCRGCKE